jgi:hypothetical protein
MLLTLIDMVVESTRGVDSTPRVDSAITTYLRERDHVLTGAGSRTYGSGITYLRERRSGLNQWKHLLYQTLDCIRLF